MACSSDSKSLLAVLTFSVSSSGLLLVNKLCLKEVALPSFLAVLQFIASVLCAVGMSAAGAADLDPLEWPRVRIYLFYIALFATAIYSNLQALTHSNVETLIVFRACGPLLVSVLEWRLLGRALPSRWSAVALSGIFACAAGYVASDNAFAMHGLRAYTCGVYFVSICLSDTCGKQIISGLRWRTMWGPVPRLAAAAWRPRGVALYALSCLFGIAISFTGWRCRALVSATCYTVAIWEHHATPEGIACLAGCLLCAAAYRPAPMRRSEDQLARGRGDAEAPRDDDGSSESEAFLAAREKSAD
ncbi:hypothetical protein EMIHUDRAFT_234330 [Emiliania huxleyi CCMP1516]|uniref:Sugar phosphate transporter domain-containing protein n=2 Tax=Emiliania huxleyi TaxID=2903 RepID=A0A0D3JZN5_EMIH1|nr:hypothetical protein EMIHUDRAFT_234330 [Emiliania huxleyi CCMP1516]EOD28970.1 hypothetical protein EMIHUDRAFT_234330 [Emiliania huxleyi CCMP1516]|eukprot:XP_005781399.1 hypothetical protein EMIHUDRAFT_234330 [Emiliania huxleyi CCMP1516]